MAKQLTIDEEFRDLLPPLTADEKSQLRQQIEADGCTDQIIVWANHEDTIVDGHHRYDICTATDRPFKTKAIQFENRDQVKAWMLRQQGGRRNISQQKLSYIRGTAYNKRKCSHGSANGEDRAHGQKPSRGHDGPLTKTADIVAADYKVSPRTIKREAKFADRLNELTASERKAILDGTRKELPKGDEKSQAEEILERLKQGPASKENLLAISANYKGRISDLRDRGHNIPTPINGIYTLEPGKPKKKTQQLPKQFRYEKPEGTDAAITRINMRCSF